MKEISVDNRVDDSGVVLGIKSNVDTWINKAS